MQQVQFISTTPEQLQESILKGLKSQLDELKKGIPTKATRRVFKSR